MTPADPVPYVGPITARHQLDWLALVHEYRRLDTLRQADEAFGPSANAYRDFELKRIKLETKYGSMKAAWSDPIGRSEVERLTAEIEKCTDRQVADFFDPVESAAVKLVLAPAPDLDAVNFKIGIIKDLELDGRASMPGSPFDFVMADLDRLAGAA